MSGVIIRLLEPNDSAEDIGELFEQLTDEFEGSVQIARIAYAQHCYSFVGVAEEGDIVAFGALTVSFIPSKGGLVGELEDIVVHSDFCGQGIGTRLVQELLHTAEQLLVDTVYLTSNRNRTEARAMYTDKFGFEKVNTDLFCKKL